MSALKSYALIFEMVNCCYENCGRPFMLDSNMIKHYRSNKKDFKCPYCFGTQGFYGQSEEERLKEEVAALKRGKKFAERQAESARNAERYQKNCARAQKAAKTRLKNRMKNGVCPCCNRTFKQLAAHMKNKHPDYMEHKK